MLDIPMIPQKRIEPPGLKPQAQNPKHCGNLMQNAMVIKGSLLPEDWMAVCGHAAPVPITDL